MRIITLLTATAIAATALTTTVSADGHAAAAMKERQAHMKMYGKNLGVLGDMAKGAKDYDATAAQAAADALVKLANVDQSGFWPEGSDTSIKDSRALPKIWEDMAAFEKINVQLAAAAATMAGVASDGLPAVQGAIGGIGASCGTCHKAYRQPK